MWKLVQLALMLPVAALPAFLSWSLISLGGRFEGPLGQATHGFFWLPAILVLLGVFRVWRQAGIRICLVPLSACSLFLGLGLAAENWPHTVSDPGAIISVSYYSLVPVVVLAIDHRTRSRGQNHASQASV